MHVCMFKYNYVSIMRIPTRPKKHNGISSVINSDKPSYERCDETSTRN